VPEYVAAIAPEIDELEEKGGFARVGWAAEEVDLVLGEDAVYD
jgi:hypothetical protein